MAASDDVAALGAQDLAGVAGEVSSNSAAVRAMASSWEQAASGCEQQTAAVNRAAATGAHNWSGSAEQEFAYMMSQFATSSSNEQDCLRTGSRALTAAADALDEAQTTVEGICERLYTMLGVLRKDTELSGPSFDFNSAAAQMTAEATDQARGAAATAEHTLSQACATLDSVLSQMQGGLAFSSLYVPTSKGFTPRVSVSGAPPQIDTWISEATAVLESHGTPASKINPEDIWIIIEHESSGNKNAENKWDINWQEGHPSIGLMQVIQPTFNRYMLPGHENIWNPVDNIIAGVRYALANYQGSLSNVPGVVAVRNGEPYVGY
jgi:uncharacterized protein YukE